MPETPCRRSPEAGTDPETTPATIPPPAQARRQTLCPAVTSRRMMLSIDARHRLCAEAKVPVTRAEPAARCVTVWTASVRNSPQHGRIGFRSLDT